MYLRPMISNACVLPSVRSNTFVLRLRAWQTLRVYLETDLICAYYDSPIIIVVRPDFPTVLCAGIPSQLSWLHTDRQVRQYSSITATTIYATGPLTLLNNILVALCGFMHVCRLSRGAQKTSTCTSIMEHMPIFQFIKKDPKGGM